MSGLALDAWLAGLPAQALVFVLVLCRVSAAVMVMPAFGAQDFPMTVRAGIALSLSLLVMPLVRFAPGVDPGAVGPWRLGGMVALELLVGGLIGWLAQLAALALPIAGQVISLMTGLSSVLQPDPSLGSEIAAPSRMFGLLAPVLMLTTGAWVLPVRAVVGSYGLVPAGSALLGAHALLIGAGAGAPVPLVGAGVPAPLAGVGASAPLIGDGAQAVVWMTGRAFALAFELAAPFVLLSLVWEVAAGLLGRLVTNLQIYNLLSPLQILGGVAALAVLMRAMVETWQGRAFDLLAGLPGL